MEPKPDDFNIRKFCSIFITLADEGRDIEYFNSAFKTFDLSTCNDLEIMVVIITAVNWHYYREERKPSYLVRQILSNTSLEDKLKNLTVTQDMNNWLTKTNFITPVPKVGETINILTVLANKFSTKIYTNLKVYESYIKEDNLKNIMIKLYQKNVNSSIIPPLHTEEQFNSILTELQSAFNHKYLNVLKGKLSQEVSQKLPAEVNFMNNDDLSNWFISGRIINLLKPIVNKLREEEQDAEFDEYNKTWKNRDIEKLNSTIYTIEEIFELFQKINGEEISID